jgi:hypothetical protein
MGGKLACWKIRGVDIRIGGVGLERIDKRSKISGHRILPCDRDPRF